MGVAPLRHAGFMAESLPWPRSSGPCTPRSAGPRGCVSESRSPTRTSRPRFVISADELEDLEDALAVAQSLLREAASETMWIPHDEVKRRLGLCRQDVDAAT